MTPFRWNFMGRIAWARYERHDMQEFKGWWRHVAFGIYIFHYKRIHGWE